MYYYSDTATRIVHDRFAIFLLSNLLLARQGIQVLQLELSMSTALSRTLRKLRPPDRGVQAALT